MHRRWPQDTRLLSSLLLVTTMTNRVGQNNHVKPPAAGRDTPTEAILSGDSPLFNRTKGAFLLAGGIDCCREVLRPKASKRLDNVGTPAPAWKGGDWLGLAPPSCPGYR